MKTFYFIFAAFSFINTSCESTDKAYMPDRWRCGAPIVREIAANNTLNSEKEMSSVNLLKSVFTTISKKNIERYEKKLFPLSNDEKLLVWIISEKLFPPIIHRTSISKLELILKSGKGLVSPTKLGVKPSTTQPVEQRLFSGEDCVFASVAFLNGEKNFGDVIIKIKNKDAFSWGSLYAGHTWIRGVLDISVEKPISPDLKLDFANQIFVSHHYSKIIAYQIIKNIRLGISVRSWGEPYNKETILSDILAATKPLDFWSKIYKYRLGFLEAHFIENVSLENFEIISVKHKDKKYIRSLMKELNLDLKLLHTH